MVKRRTIKKILEELEYSKDRYQDYIREGQKEDAERVKQDIEELEEELAEAERGNKNAVPDV